MSKEEDFELNDVDKNNLDTEWVNQERMMGYYGKMLAEAKHALDMAEVDEKYKETMIANKVRATPERYGRDKVTNEAVKEVVIERMYESKVQKKRMKAQLHKDMVEQVIYRLNARGRAISDLIHLHTIEYFARPKVSKGKKDDINRMKDERMSKRRIK